MVRVPLESTSEESSKVATTLGRGIKRCKTSHMEEYRALNRFWKSELKECVQRATACKYSGICQVRCGQLEKTNVMGNFRVFLKINWIVKRLMRTLWDVHSDSPKRVNEQNSRTVYHLLENHGEIYDSLTKNMKTIKPQRATKLIAVFLCG